MSVAHLILGIAALAVGSVCALGRNSVVAWQRERFSDRPAQAPALYLLLGVILMLVGVSQLVLGFA